MYIKYSLELIVYLKSLANSKLYIVNERYFFMTVINMLSMGDEGVAVADEQSSGITRKYNVSQKLHLIGGRTVFGGSGPADFIREVYDGTVGKTEAKNSELKLKSKDVFEATKQTLFDAKNNKKAEILFANYGLTMDELRTGSSASSGKPLDSDLKQSAVSVLQRVDQDFGISILLGGFDNGRFVIYGIDSARGGAKISRPYSSIGAGSDEADKVLSSYIIGLPRDKRESIDGAEGLVKTIEATNAASHVNIGVGGTPSIVYMRAGKRPAIPGERECILATELVHGLTFGFLDRNFTYDAVRGLVLGDKEFGVVEEAMRGASKDWRAFDRSLRGYKK